MTSILHISDIHWRGQTRHQEYVNALTWLLDYQRNHLQADLCLVTGDVWHTKTQGIAPESIEVLTWFWRELSRSFLGVRAILGNHDGNLTNLTRQDVISPVLQALNLPNVTLWKNSGVFTEEVDSRIRWGVFSPFDKDGWKSVHPDRSGSDNINIGLFHGVIQGAETDSQWRMQHHEATVEHFRDRGYDFVLLGDIHNRQVLETRQNLQGKEQGWIAYAGSLIQQNHGESLVKGGLVWDIRGKRDWTLQEVDVPAFQPFLTIPWKGTVTETLAAHQDALRPGARVRVVSSGPVGLGDSRDLRTRCLETHQCESVTWKFDTAAPLGRQETSLVENSTSSEGEPQVTRGVGLCNKQSLRAHPESLVQMFHQWSQGTGQVVESETLDGASSRLLRYLQSHVETERTESEDSQDGAHDVLWSPTSLRFENTFRYRTKNHLDIKTLSGVVGLFAGNATGKSSVVGSLLYGLFGATDRGPVKGAHVINILEKMCHSEVEFKVGPDTFVVDRKTFRKEPKKKKGTDKVITDETNTVLNLWQVEADGTRVSRNGDTGPDTDRAIRQLIGTADDFLLTSMSTQGDLTRFIDRGATQRKLILSRFLDLDLFEKLAVMAKDDFLEAKTSAGTWSPETHRKEVQDLGVQIQDLEQALVDLEGRKGAVAAELAGISHQAIAEARLQQVTKANLDRVESKLRAERARLEKLQEEEAATLVRLEGMPSEADLYARSDRYQHLSEKLGALGARVTSEQHTLAQQKKSVKTLSQVPCGTMFPECKFIRDGHQASTLLDGQAALVQDLLASKEELETAIQSLGDTSRELRMLEATRTILSRVMAEVAVTLGSVSKLEMEATTLRDHLTGLEDGSEQQQQILATQQELENRSRFLETEIRKCIEGLGARRQKLATLTARAEEKTRARESLAELELLCQALGKTGLPAAVLAEQLPILNQELDRILLGVADFRVLLEADVTGSNAMEIWLEDDTGRRPVEVASGAEQMISSLALRVALYNLSTLPKPDVFIIDEGFGVLDSKNLQKVTGFLQSLKQWFRLVLVISHVSEVKEAVDGYLEIGDEEGYPVIRA